MIYVKIVCDELKKCLSKPLLPFKPSLKAYQRFDCLYVPFAHRSVFQHWQINVVRCLRPISNAADRYENMFVGIVSCVTTDFLIQMFC